MVTCPGCACESLSYTEGLPCRALDQGKDMEHSALAVHMVRDRWHAILTGLGKEVSHISIAFPCEMFEPDRAAILERLAGNDTVAILACSGAFVALRDLLASHTARGIRLVPMMKTTGTFIFRLVYDETAENSMVEKDTARILNFSEKNADTPQTEDG